MHGGKSTGAPKSNENALKRIKADIIGDQCLLMAQADQVPLPLPGGPGCGEPLKIPFAAQRDL
jgi:hypothetical protein